MNNIELLKIKREFVKIKKNIFEDCNLIFTQIEDVNFIVNNFQYLDNITIEQYSRFGFQISYMIYYKNIMIYDVDENVMKLNKYQMNDLILSDLNKSRFRKICQRKLETLQQIEY
jgi:hypothetical protein